MHKHIFVNKFASGTPNAIFFAPFLTAGAAERQLGYLRHKVAFKMSDFIASAQELHVQLQKIL
nr:hypothetical protein [Janthinobacterium sp. Marseille]